MVAKYLHKTHVPVMILFVMLVFVLAACGPNSAKTGRAMAGVPVASSDEGAAAESGSTAQEEHAATEDDHHAATEDETADEAAQHDSANTMTGGAAMGHGEAMPHMEGTGHEDMAAAHNVPEAYARLENPVEATDSSIARGAELFQATCAVCHGETGRGEGTGAAGLNPKPANLSDAHVQGNPDGALFYTISKGVPGTAMAAWESQISEEDRWHLVNFIRTIKPQ